jgi:hypothetical protein
LVALRIEMWKAMSADRASSSPCGGGLHPAQALADLFQSGLVGVAGGQGGGGGLDAQAHLGELGQQAQAELAFQQPAQDVGIQQVPLGLGLDHGAVAGAGAEQALGRQHLHRFAGDGAAGAELLGEFALGRKADGDIFAGDNGLTKRLDQTIGQTEARLSAHRLVFFPTGRARSESTLCSVVRSSQEPPAHNEYIVVTELSDQFYANGPRRVESRGDRDARGRRGRTHHQMA